MRITQCVVALVATTIVACGGSKGGPPAAPVVTLVSLSLSGPSMIAPGSMAAFTATGHMSDGSTQDFSAKVAWTTQDGNVLSVANTGLASGRAPGESLLTAASVTFRATLSVLVLPPGTFRLTGTVLDGDAPVVGATVSVTAGTGAGLSTTTDGSGLYRLYGVAGSVQLRVTNLGYQDAAPSIIVTGQASLDVHLTSSGPAPNLAGVYSMAITAASSCFGSLEALTPDLRQRHYLATITQSGRILQVSLSGATFVLTGDGHGSSFSAHVDSAGVTFQVGDGYYYAGPDLLESLDDGRSVLISGNGTLTMSAGSLVGSINGSYIIGNSVRVWTNHWVLAGCNGNNPVTFTPQSAPARIRR